MEKPKNLFWVVAVITVVLSLVLATVAGAVAGGLAGYFLGRGQTVVPDQEARLAELEFQLQNLRMRLNEITYPLLPETPQEPIRLPTPTPMPVRPPVEMTGALVIEVVSGTPAERAGLRPGDVILAVDDEPVAPGRPLADIIAQYRPGDQVVLRIRRGGAEPIDELPVGLAENPQYPGRGYLGVRVQQMVAPEQPLP